MSFRIEVANDIRGCSATVPLQEEVWSGDVIVPPQLMLAAAHNGGFVGLGYAEGDPVAAGFVFGFLGIQRGHFRRILESHPQLALALLPILTRRIRNAEGTLPG
ncbi:MAG: hypothetical protein M3R54_05825, partial [Chloroflexota bacterium]|nr:hypothetical protein [Chloroflexota bacterium]